MHVGLLLALGSGGKKVKLCLMKESLDYGGNERSVANISLALQHEFETICLVFDGTKNRYQHGGRLVDLHLPSAHNLFCRVVRNVQRYLRVRRIISEEQIDILYQFVNLKSLLSKLPQPGCIKVISARDYGAISKDPQRFKKCLNSSDAMICNSNYIRDKYLQSFPEDADKVFTVYNIIDTDGIRKQALLPVNDDGFQNFRKKHKQLLVGVGRFCREKGFEHLIEAFALAKESIPELGLVLIGDGEYKAYYKEIIAHKSLTEAVYFTGFQKNPYQYVAQCDAYVLSSVSEGFPNVLAEAMALGLPVISVNCYSGPAEILLQNSDYHYVKDHFAEGDYGIITPHYDCVQTDKAVEEMAEAIKYLLDNAALMQHYSEAAKERAESFTANKATDQFKSIFSELSQRRRNR